MDNGLSVTTNILKTLATSSSIGMFARDTGGCLISRLALSRSHDESREISIAELSESVIFYFSAPLLAKGTAKMFSKVYDVNRNLFSTPLKDLKNTDSAVLKKIKLGKFGQIVTTFGLILPAIFAIAPIRNMVTLAKSQKDKFTSVVALDKNKKNTNTTQEAKDKSKKLLKTLSKISAVSIGITAGILALAKNKKIYNAIEPGITKIVKGLEFTKSGDLELMHYGALIYPVSIASYFYASRDKYEVMENVRRFSITVPLLFGGEKLIQNPIHKFFDKKFGTNVIDKNGIKSYSDILKLPSKQRDKLLKTKNWAYGLTFLINTMAIAAAVAALNRFETKRNFERDNKNKSSQLI